MGCLLQRFEQQLRVWSWQPMLWQHLPSTWQQVLPYKGLELCIDRGHQVCWLELRFRRLQEPPGCRVPVRCAQLMLWQHLCWGRRCLLSERAWSRLRVWSRLTVRQERVSCRSLRCLNSSAPPFPKVLDLLQGSSSAAACKPHVLASVAAFSWRCLGVLL